ncbi:orexigenic neuropeptide QRFP [Marmota monax]|uniref:orexigenic neuropeptide QRFP n=1 Tax=Marmota monax TaxID=9995 RepID=UPI0026F1AE69|nr:orexigenic neuropeptide QRFP [Marmota monax]
MKGNESKFPQPSRGCLGTALSRSEPECDSAKLLRRLCGRDRGSVRSHLSTPFLLLLPLGACLPLLDTREPTDTGGAIAAGMSWAHLAQGSRPHFVWGPARWPRAPHAQAPLARAEGLPASGGEQAGLRLARQDGSEAPGEKAGGPLGSLAEELSGYSRKKGGFSFRFGRRRRRARRSRGAAPHVSPALLLQPPRPRPVGC